MNLKILRLAGFFGIIAPLFGLLLIGGSLWLSPWFSWSGNALSDLGGTDGFESIVFNSGLAMVGALMMMFSTGLFEMSKDDRIGQAGSCLYLFTAVLLIAIGFVNVTVEPWHNYLGLVFFFAFPLSALVFGYFCFRRGMRFYALLSWGAAVLSVMIWLFSWGSPAVPEVLSVVDMGVWEILLGYWMYSRKEDRLAD